MVSGSYESDYHKLFLELVKTYGGFFNAHTHLDRANTVERKYLSHMSMDPVEASSYSLKVKQNLTGDLHRGEAYTKQDLEARMRNQLDMMIRFGTAKTISFIDTTADNVGLNAFETALKLKREYKRQIDLQLAAYGIFGFKNSDSERWNLFEKAAERADVIGSLPERDDKEGHIGYDEHIRRMLKLGQKLHKPVHLQVDQANDPNENGTETLVEAVRWIGAPEIAGEKTSVWAVHAISPSGYNNKRFGKLLEGMKKYSIGCICCPAAAISMRQLRPFKTYTHNSIARVLEMLEYGIDVRLGTDNIADVFIPSGTPDMYKEIFLLSNAVRFYNPEILAKVATAIQLTDMDRELVSRALEQDRETWKNINEQG
jgi:cytosine/adenosine deaminase-related metal-dependent hydrolase